jgi:hypothetical protein
MEFFLWHNVFFYLSLSIGILTLIGTSIGILDFDVDVDIDDAGKASVLDLGRVPFTLLVLMSTLIFGICGLISNMVLISFVPSSILGWVSFVVAFCLMMFFTKRLSRLVIKHMPTTETDGVSKSAAQGSSGILVISTNENSGLGNIKITNQKGYSTHQRMQCRSEFGTLKKGTHIVVTNFDDETHICTVTPIH